MDTENTNFHKARDKTSGVESLLDLQRTHGNAFVQRLVQHKLAVSRARDEYEQKAGRVAAQVIWMLDNTAISARRSAIMSVKASLASRKGGARPLSDSERIFFEPQLGRNSNGVCGHADSQAGRPAKMIPAGAFTFRHDQTGSLEGKRCIGRKLAHTIEHKHSVFQLQRQTNLVDTCNGHVYDPKKMCCRSGKLIRQSPIKNLEECPDRKQLRGRPNEYEGCSVPWFLHIGEDKDNPAGGRDTAFSDTSIHGIRPQAFVPALPCDVHDKCYQTCNPDPVARELCDMKLIVDASRVCNNSTEDEEVKKRCRKAVEKANYLLVRHAFGEESFEERQQQYCHCCPPPARENKQRQMITNTENVRLASDPVHWDEEAFILRRLPERTLVKVLDEGAGKSFNDTDPEYQWWYVEVDGGKGWVMQVLLDDVTGSP